jgi:hypothetical protein
MRSNGLYDAQYFPYGGDKVGILFRNITDRKKAEEALKKKESELTFKTSPKPSSNRSPKEHFKPVSQKNSWRRQQRPSQAGLGESFSLSSLSLQPFAKG